MSKSRGVASFELRRGEEVLQTFTSLTKFAQHVLDDPKYLYAAALYETRSLTLHQVERSDILIAGKGKGKASSDGSFIPGCQLGS